MPIFLLFSGPPLPPPPGMFPVQRRHPAEMLMTPPRPPFPPQGHATPPLTTSTPQVCLQMVVLLVLSTTVKCLHMRQIKAMLSSYHAFKQ